MNVRLSFLLVAVLIIFGGTFLALRFTQSAQREPDNPWLFHVDDGSIVQIEVTHQDQTVGYAQKPGGAGWYIQEDPEVPVFLDKWLGTTLLLSGPRVSRVLSADLEDLAPYGLDPPVTVIKVIERSGFVYEFHLGSVTPDGSNQYTRLVGDPTLFTVPEVWGRVVTQLATDPPYPRLYNIDSDDSIGAFSVTRGGETVTYQRRLGGNQWYILGEPEVPVSADNWGQTLQGISYPRASQVLSEWAEDPAAYGLDPPQISVRVMTNARKTFEVHLGHATPDGRDRYARSVQAEDPHLYTVPEAWAQMIDRLATDPPYQPAEAPQSEELPPEEEAPDAG